MKKFLLSSLIFSICLSVSASELKNIPYKNIKDNSKISAIGEAWSKNVNKKSGNYYIRQASNFYNPDESIAFATECDYLFLNKNRLLGYSNSDLKFYEFFSNDGTISKTELTEDQIKTLFKNYRIVKISDFTTTTSSIKIKKGLGNLNIILLNDTDRIFNNYSFTTGNSKLEKYPLNGMITISKKGMILFSKFGENSKDYPWFVILVR